MNPIDQAIQLLSRQPCCGYQAGAATAVEPTALAALALAGCGRTEEAGQAGDWLAAQQSSTGTLGVSTQETSPHWPTALAVLAWRAVGQKTNSTLAERFQPRTTSALKWLTDVRGKPLSKTDSSVGHDSTLVGWPWVEGTHSWVEPTAWSMLALRSAGQPDHPRAREAARMLVDRILPKGGCNYGNTVVLGQELRPHVQPTGLALLALAGERDHSGKIASSIGYLSQTISAETTTASLSYALLGLAAHDAAPPRATDWIAKALHRTIERGAAPLQLALGVLASLGRSSPLIMLTR